MKRKREDHGPLDQTQKPPAIHRLFRPCRNVFEFTRLECLGEGTFGRVHRAMDQKTGDIVALKRIKELETDKNGFSITPLREIRVLMESRHPNIVEIKEVVADDQLDKYERWFVVMEYLEHELKDLMKNMRSNFSIPEVKCFLIQLLKGVAHLHNNHIIHRSVERGPLTTCQPSRDLKTSNLLLNNSGVLKICDFGLARFIKREDEDYSPGVVTLWYRAPEVMLGDKKYTSAIDMWSVGCIFAEMILGEPLLPGESEIQMMGKFFETIGMPEPTDWNDLKDLPNSKAIVLKNRPHNLLRVKFPPDVLSENGYDLLRRLLCFSPKKRITAQEALNHPFFKEIPLAQHPSLMPTFPAQVDRNK